MPLYALNDWRPELPPESEYWIAPNASLIGRVRLGKGASIWFGSVIRADNDWITIGERANVSVGHGAVIHGATVGDTTIIGMGATLLNRCRIGRNSIVGANALIPEGKEFPDNSLIVGVPGRAIRSIAEAERPMLLLNAQIYFDRWQRYREELRLISAG